jgi:4'-phosphopantetheinyl transferase
MDNNTIDLWCAYPDDLLSEEFAQACLRLLSADEHERWCSYKFDRSKREYLATHALARTALSHGRGIAPDVLRFEIGPHGKPTLNPECGLAFNLSNAVGLVVCLVGVGGALGVDVEPRARAESIREVSARVFSPLELAQLHDLPADQQLERCLQLWTLKEAYIKARGLGFKLPLRSLSFVYETADAVRLQFDPILNDDEARWRFCILEHAEHCIALMVDSRTSPNLHVWEARPPFATRRALNSVIGVWHP